MRRKIIIGLIAGIISGFFASGGGMILVPSYVYLLHIPEKRARATSILSILPMVVISSVFYYQGQKINWKIGILCAIGGLIGGVLGAKLLKKLSIPVLKIIFIFFLLYASVKMVFF